MAGGAAAAAAGGLLGLEFCIPSLLLCWFCCWNDSNSESSSTEGGQPMKPIIRTAKSVSRHSRRESEELARRAGSSTSSLRLPAHSRGTPLHVSHRSHEELRGAPLRQRDESLAAPGGSGSTGSEGSRYHSAPSVLHQVLHRRDWETQLHARDTDFTIIPLTDSPRPSHDLETATTCKKHNKNIKSSKKLSKEDSRIQDPKDFEEPPTFIDDNGDTSPANSTYNSKNIETIINAKIDETEINNDIIIKRQPSKTQFKVKEAKQSYNESIKHRNSMKISRTSEENEPTSCKVTEDFSTIEVEGMNDGADLSVDGSVDVISLRSGAMHHGSKDSLTTCHSKMDYPRASVEAVSYSVAECYLQTGSVGLAGSGGVRGRLASDGDILETTHRPHSTAFSESDLELELQISASNEPPPPYCLTKERDAITPVKHTTKRRKETAL